MIIREHWARVFVDERKFFAYGPRLGRLYLFDDQQDLDDSLQGVLGLGDVSVCREIRDSAESILHDQPSLKTIPLKTPPVMLRMAYRFMHYSRHFISFRFLLSLTAWFARARGKDLQLELMQIGKLERDIENLVGLADCYPRALMMCYLCLRCGYNCEVFIGILAPTKMLHAWCVVNGEIPYEAMPEHYMYQPLVCWQLAAQ